MPGSILSLPGSSREAAMRFSIAAVSQESQASELYRSARVENGGECIAPSF